MAADGGEVATGKHGRRASGKDLRVGVART